MKWMNLELTENEKKFIKIQKTSLEIMRELLKMSMIPKKYFDDRRSS